MAEKKGLFGGLFGGGKKSDCCSMEIVEDDDKKSSCCNMEIVPDEDEGDSCCAGGSCCGGEAAPHIEGAMTIKILGPGCKNCVTLAENTKLALAQMGIGANIEKVEDVAVIAGYGVMSTPAIVVDEKVLSYGKVLKPNKIVALLEKVAK